MTSIWWAAVSCLLCSLQYLTMVELLESIDCMVKNAPYRKFRPDVSVHISPNLWKVQNLKGLFSVEWRFYSMVLHFDLFLLPGGGTPSTALWMSKSDGSVACGPGPTSDSTDWTSRPTGTPTRPNCWVKANQTSKQINLFRYSCGLTRQDCAAWTTRRTLSELAIDWLFEDPFLLPVC